jgi:thiamine-phosphate pyrophosphorylase
MGSAPFGPLLVVTDRHQAQAAGRTLLETIGAAADAGALAVLLREKDLSRRRRAALAAELQERVAPRGGRLVVASDEKLARSVGGAAVHLASSDPWVEPAGELPVGRSTHNASEVEAAAKKGCAYATISPVFPTTSKPGYGPALGVEGLRAMVQVAGELPLFALGGITPETVASCLAAGAYGVAVMGAVMVATDPAGVVRSLLAAAASG